MNLNSLSISGPFTHENLSLFLLRGSDAFDGSRFIPLDEAMEQKCVIVHETDNVGELEVENLSEGLDLYVQAGDVVKGGRQVRTLGVDFVLPAKSGRVPIPSFSPAPPAKVIHLKQAGTLRALRTRNSTAPARSECGRTS